MRAYEDAIVPVSASRTDGDAFAKERVTDRTLPSPVSTVLAVELLRWLLDASGFAAPRPLARMDYSDGLPSDARQATPRQIDTGPPELAL